MLPDASAAIRETLDACRGGACHDPCLFRTLISPLAIQQRRQKHMGHCFLNLCSAWLFFT